MNIPVRDVAAAQTLAIVDCDIHPIQRTPTDLHPFLEQRWRDHMASFGTHVRQGLVGQMAYPRMMAAGQRSDAYPPGGGAPGSDFELMKRQHLDPNGIAHGMLMPLSRSGMEERNLEYGAALARASNDWQIAAWIEKDTRLHGGIVVAQEDPDAAVAEIERRAGDRRFAQIVISPRTSEPLGRKRYWPIFAAAERANLPIGLHPSGISGGNPSTGAGWPTYYMQEHYTFITGTQDVVASMVFEGVFERFPKLRIALIESGFTWAPALCWRMDKYWERMRKEVPHVRRPPSEYVHEQVWFATQPVEEPESPEHLAEVIAWIGWNRLLFSSDYPHWDFDDPKHAFRIRMTDEQKAKLFRDNATALYALQ
jgi:predicted TIM-barrel fold metal-dependent hydrolase